MMVFTKVIISLLIIESQTMVTDTACNPVVVVNLAFFIFSFIA